MTVFVIGTANRLEVGDEVYVRPGGIAENVFTGKKSRYGPYLVVRRKGSASSFHAPMKRGVAQEVT